MAWELLRLAELVLWPWKLRVSLHGSQTPGHSCPPEVVTLQWKGSSEYHPDAGRAPEMLYSLTAAGCEHDEIRCRHLPYRHVKLQETNPRRAHLYQLFATARAGHSSLSCSLPRAGNSSVSWFLKCSHLINVTGLSVEICEWNIIVWARKRVEGDELKVCPGLRLRAIEPEPNVVQSCYLSHNVSKLLIQTVQGSPNPRAQLFIQ